ncbi:TetR family transcriptional regulator [Nocardia speluncae]|uniref:TetR family transcriptional regulator n=1 Tax=Nocardia speluncae TaxID=419477 RepID=A0A846XD78_9NOCA|nr:TetR family transcriptional regulator [Nocardia speluncae]NKY32636.1 TetR family transcriptional regulator [Nocardia speluncae]
MPTGVHIRDARQQLFDAAERILLRDGAGALTSRAVTAEAGVAKGVLHRYFADFDAFLAELVGDRLARLADQAVTLRGSAGTGTVTGNLTEALAELFDPVAVAIVALVVARDELRTRLRRNRPIPGLPVLTEAGTMIAVYLADECALGRIAADADTDSLALSLIGAGHLLFAGAPVRPDTAAVARIVETITADVVQRRLL